MRAGTSRCRGVLGSLALLVPVAGAAHAGFQEAPDAPGTTGVGGVRAAGDVVRPGFPVAAWRVVDLDGDGRAEVLCVGVAGEVRTWSAGEGGTLSGGAGGEAGPGGEAGMGELVLADPRRSVLALDGDALVVASPRGVHTHAIGTGGVVAQEERVLARRARFPLRTGRPLFADILQDVNGDGAPDLVLPVGRACELWLREGASFVRAATVPVRLRHAQDTDVELLSDTLGEALRIPRLATDDVNGDGRQDLVVLEEGRRSFHLQRPDGTFAGTPDTVLDLGLFRDTTPAASLRPGRTLVAGDEATVQSSDLDDDGIPDYVVAHRRKVWVFHADGDGPQFERPSSILKTAEDVTGLLLLHLDDDPHPDLLIYKVLVPSVASLVLGMFGSLDIEVTALGYPSEGGERFSTRAREQGVLVIRLPPLVEILRRPEDLLDRLDEAGRKFRAAVRGDFDGDGVDDVALVSEDAQTLEVWRTPSAEALASEEEDDAVIRRLLFDQEDPVFDVDRVLGLFADFADRRTRRLTGGRAADGRGGLGEGSGLPLVGAIAADVDGDGRDEVVTVYVGPGGSTAFKVLEATPGEGR